MDQEFDRRRSGGGGSAVDGAVGAPGKGTLVESGDHGTPRNETGSGLGSPRFQEDPDLKAIAAGKKTLGTAASGIAVTKIQRALVELGCVLSATGTVDAATTKALTAYQKSKGVTQSGVIDKDTLVALDADYTGNHPEAKTLGGMKPAKQATEGTQYTWATAPAELTTPTHVLTPAEKAAAQTAISTEVQPDPVTGTLPTFKETAAGKKYGDEVEAALTAEINGLLTGAKTDEAARNAGNTYAWKDIEAVGVQSKNATDAIFGNYARGPALTATGADPKIKDAWDQKEKDLKNVSAQDDAVEWRVEKILTGEKSIHDIDTAHGAIQHRAAESKILDAIRKKVTAARRADLLLIHKDWPGFESGGKTFIQRMQPIDPKTKKPDQSIGRGYMWEQFQTIIHEYIHSLENNAHVKMRGKMSEQKGNKVLREGACDYFTKIVNGNTTITPALRTAVEGPFHDPKVTHTVPALTTYDESENAERLAGIVGLPNLCGAFFLGKTDLIGQ